jgi:hypothetical protein
MLITRSPESTALMQRFYRKAVPVPFDGPANPAGLSGFAGLGDAIPGGDTNLLYTGTDSPSLPAPDASAGDDGINWPVLFVVGAAGVLIAALLMDGED